jgi:hypothetical protein
MVNWNFVYTVGLLVFIGMVLVILIILIIWWFKLRKIEKNIPIDDFDDFKKLKDINLDRDYLYRKKIKQEILKREKNEKEVETNGTKNNEGVNDSQSVYDSGKTEGESFRGENDDATRQLREEIDERDRIYEESYRGVEEPHTGFGKRENDIPVSDRTRERKEVQIRTDAEHKRPDKDNKRKFRFSR